MSLKITGYAIENGPYEALVTTNTQSFTNYVNITKYEYVSIFVSNITSFYGASAVIKLELRLVTSDITTEAGKY